MLITRTAGRLVPTTSKCGGTKPAEWALCLWCFFLALWCFLCFLCFLALALAQPFFGFFLWCFFLWCFLCLCFFAALALCFLEALWCFFFLCLALWCFLDFLAALHFELALLGAPGVASGVKLPRSVMRNAPTSVATIGRPSRIVTSLAMTSGRLPDMSVKCSPASRDR